MGEPKYLVRLVLEKKPGSRLDTIIFESQHENPTDAMISCNAVVGLHPMVYRSRVELYENGELLMPNEDREEDIREFYRVANLGIN